MKTYKEGDTVTTEYGDTYQLSHNQALFCNDVIDSGYARELYFDYSGRAMYGKECPAVNVEELNDIQTKASTCNDSMGRRFVLYARN